MSDVLGRTAAAAGTGFLTAGPIGALVGVATSLVPELIRAITGSGDAAAAAETVASAVRDVTGTSDPVEAASILTNNQEKLLEFRQKVLELQMQTEKNQQEAALATLRASNEDLQNSRNMLMQLTQQKHSLAWMPAYQTIVVGVVFMSSLAALFAMVFLGVGDLKTGMREILVMILGILAGEFRGACQFWIGGSRAGSLAATSALPASSTTTVTEAPASPAAPARRSLFR